MQAGRQALTASNLKLTKILVNIDQQTKRQTDRLISIKIDKKCFGA